MPQIIQVGYIFLIIYTQQYGSDRSEVVMATSYFVAYKLISRD